MEKRKIRMKEILITKVRKLIEKLQQLNQEQDILVDYIFEDTDINGENFYYTDIEIYKSYSS